MPRSSLPKSERPGLLQRITAAESGDVYLILAVLTAYAVIPLALYLWLDVDSNYAELAAVSAVTALGIWMGSRIGMFDRIRVVKWQLPAPLFHRIVWGVFIAFVCIAWLTAEKIPLIAALSGADPDTIAVLREQFLKSREGWQASFVYINAVLSGALIPYSIALMFLQRVPARWYAFFFFLAFAISFVEKAFFFKAALPLIYLVVQQKIRFPVSPKVLIGGALAMLGLVTVLSGAGASPEDGGDAFFTASYVPQGPLGHLVWRSVAIPLVTAADAVRVLNEDFGGQVLWGATSSLIAAATGQERIEFERLVFAAQWGQNETGTGSSNSVFLTEAYVNFGWLGALSFGIIAGLLLQLFRRSQDAAFQSLWMLFALGAYTSGLIGLLLSNGFILLFFIGLFINFRPVNTHRQP